MSIPQDSPQPAVPPGWYSTGETGPDGAPVERWWDGGGWSAMVRPLGGGTFGAQPPRRSPRTKTLIASATVVVLAAAGLGLYFGLHNGNPTTTAAQPDVQSTTNQGGNGLGGLGGGNGGGNGNGNGGGNGSGGLGSTPSPAPTVTGGSGSTVSDPINGLTIPVPTGWTGNSGSTSGEGSWPALATGTYTCPSALAQQNGSSSSSASTCTSGGVNLTTAQGTDAKTVATSNMAQFAKGNYGTLSSHSVVNEGAISVAGRTGYQITWSVVPDYSGPSGTVQLIALPDPDLPGYMAIIDIGVDKSSKAPSLSTVDSQIINNIVDANATGA
ncbi:DUF2510 domain-containing protein [Actinospica robiniae]|uniref:DUF2510 domain-containing protein n=1 Tax=Actinospica robiniae TaxID=304901 RepID=UPI000552A55C|nr:DUF2510 domain-containing protein [Actinospica robiniae]